MSGWILRTNIRKKIQKAEKKAREQVLNGKPKKKRKKSKGVSTPRNPTSRWVDDVWGEQGDIFFDGKLYWITLFKAGKDGTSEAYPCALSEEQWEEYKKHPIKAKLIGLKRSRKSGNSGTTKQSSSTRRVKTSEKSSKKKRLKKSRTKSGGKANVQSVRWQWTSTSHGLQKVS